MPRLSDEGLLSWLVVGEGLLLSGLQITHGTEMVGQDGVHMSWEPVAR
jgi:hypothetical protein